MKRKNELRIISDSWQEPLYGEDISAALLQSMRFNRNYLEGDGLDWEPLLTFARTETAKLIRSLVLPHFALSVDEAEQKLRYGETNMSGSVELPDVYNSGLFRFVKSHTLAMMALREMADTEKAINASKEYSFTVKFSYIENESGGYSFVWKMSKRK
jgi:hypothetical protein